MPRSESVLLIAAAFLLQAGCPGNADRPAGPDTPAEVSDISGEKYFPAVHAAFQSAKDSIYVAMYSVRVYPDRKSSPSHVLVEDIIAANKRGVKVTVYLDHSDQPGEEDNDDDGNEPAYEMLKRAGVNVRFIDKARKLHAKLIVIDRRLVVEGSANWSYSAMRKNAESASLIRSADYAAIKIKWIERLESWDEGSSARTGRRKTGSAGN